MNEIGIRFGWYLSEIGCFQISDINLNKFGYEIKQIQFDFHISHPLDIITTEMIFLVKGSPITESIKIVKVIRCKNCSKTGEVDSLISHSLKWKVSE